MGTERLTHWLSTPRTRRQVLRAALAGAALTVPLGGRVAPARAAGPHDCQKGCLWTAGRRFSAQYDHCGARLISSNVIFYYLPIVGAAESLAAGLCLDRAALKHKASAWDCLQPNCPGFDPSGPDGPCYDCTQSGGVCCPDPKQHTGYGCCTAPPGGCCKSDGCKSGESDCGG